MGSAVSAGGCSSACAAKLKLKAACAGVALGLGPEMPSLSRICSASSALLGPDAFSNVAVFRNLAAGAGASEAFTPAAAP